MREAKEYENSSFIIQYTEFVAQKITAIIIKDKNCICHGLEKMVSDYKSKTCQLCGKSFVPASGPQKYCKECAPKTSDKQGYRNFYRFTFPERVKKSKISSIKRLSKNPDWVRQKKMLRRKRRAEIQERWGKVGGLKGTWVNRSWEQSEKLAVEILKNEGFKNAKRLDYFPTCSFDVRAEKQDKICVFQVTSRTHIGDKKRHAQLAKDLGLDYLILYIKPDLTGYILKRTDISGAGADEICTKDLEAIKTT